MLWRGPPMASALYFPSMCRRKLLYALCSLPLSPFSLLFQKSKKKDQKEFGTGIQMTEKGLKRVALMVELLPFSRALALHFLLFRYQCYFSFYGAIPITCLALFLFQLYSNISIGYLPGYPQIELAGWILLALCLALSAFGLWRCGNGTLPPLSSEDREGGDGDGDGDDGGGGGGGGGGDDDGGDGGRGALHGAGSTVELISINDSHSHSAQASEVEMH